jgi:hypothetical protein
MPRLEHWHELRAVHRPLRQCSKERTMRNSILAIAAIAGVLSAPVMAQAQSETVAVVRDGPVIAVEQRPAFREYVVRERVPTYTVPARVIVGGVLPEAGITYYDVPQTYAAQPSHRSGDRVVT